MVERSFRILALFIIALNLFTSTADAEKSPSADFDVNSNRIIEQEIYSWKTYVGEEIVLIAGQSNDATTYRWELGDGTTKETELSTIAHTYDFTGMYQIRLEAEDDDGNTHTKVGQMTVVERPIARLVIRDAATNRIIDTANESIPIGTTILLDAAGSGGDLSNYYFGFQLDNVFIPQVLKNAPYYPHSYQEPGEYFIGLRVVDTLGNRSQNTREDFIKVRVVDLSVEMGEDDPSPVAAGDIISILLFVGIIGIFILAFRMKSEPNHSWGSKGQDPRKISETDRTPFYFKKIRENEITSYALPPPPHSRPSDFEFPITDRRSLHYGSYSDFRKP